MTQDPRKLAAAPTKEQIEEFRRDGLIHGNSEAWVEESNFVLNFLCDAALAALDAVPERDVAERVREVLRSHWLTEIRCDHENKTDQAFCSCSEWGGEPQNSVRLAVDDWINHILEQMK